MCLEDFGRYLQKMLSRVITPLESFTRAPCDFLHSWARDLVSQQLIQDLWGSPSRRRLDLEDLSGVAILDHPAPAELIGCARRELQELELLGEVTESKDPCALHGFVRRGGVDVWCLELG